MTDNVISFPSVGVKRKSWWFVLALSLVGATGLLLQVRTGKPSRDDAPQATPQTAMPATGFRSAARNASPAVVSILSSKTVRLSPRDLDPFFGGLFGRDSGVPRQYRERGLGSGVIVNSDGNVLTNDHVVEGATDIRIVLADKREMKATIVGTDPKTDLAVLKVDAQNLPTLPLADSSQIDVGDIVLAIGNPFGVGQSVTMGIVSATARSGVVDPEKYEDFIQTDAAINPGNSGGALITPRGDLIAINTAIISRSGGNQGIGFAIPANVARHVMNHILKDGRVVRGWLGVSIQQVDAATAKAFGLKEPAGALVGSVTMGSPAEKAGIERGDISLELNGQRLADSSDLRTRIGMADPGTSVTLKLFRDGRERTVNVKLGELRESGEKANKSTDEPSPLLGLALSELTPGSAKSLGLPPGTRGVLVDNVDADSAAADAGLRQGDVILEVNRRRVTSPGQVTAAIREAGRAPVVCFVNRGGSTLYVVLEQR